LRICTLSLASRFDSGLVEQEYLGVAPMARPMAMRWRCRADSCLGFLVEQLLDVEDAGSLDTLADLRLDSASSCSPLTIQFCPTVSVRIERVVLEHHGDIDPSAARR
jgi:hypothetical protein